MGVKNRFPLSTLSGSSDLENLSDLGLLTQAGYLTIKAVRYGDTVFLDYPNLEVKCAMAPVIYGALARWQSRRSSGRGANSKGTS